MIESIMIYVWGPWGNKTTMTNKELASEHQKHQMEGSMHMRRMEDGYMHRRMQKNKHMQGNDLDTPTYLILHVTHLSHRLDNQKRSSSCQGSSTVTP